MKRDLEIFLSFFSIFLVTASAYADTAAEVQRSQEIISQEKAVRDKIDETKQKTFIKKIAVKGVTLLSQAQIKEIISSFQGQWLTKKDIAQLLDLLKSAYKNKGYALKFLKISYEVKKNKILEITVQELSH